MIENLVAEIEVGKTYTGPISSIVELLAFVTFQVVKMVFAISQRSAMKEWKRKDQAL